MARPFGTLKYKTLEELQAAIDEYFAWCDNRVQKVYSAKNDGVVEIYDPAPYTMSGLGRRIGLSRQALSEYKKRDDYGDAVVEARNRVHEDVETRLMEKNAVGAKFNLINNFGWKEKTENEQKIDLTSKGEAITPNEGLRTEFAEFMLSKNKKE